jgi:hypothetical protein
MMISPLKCNLQSIAITPGEGGGRRWTCSGWKHPTASFGLSDMPLHRQITLFLA